MLIKAKLQKVKNTCKAGLKGLTDKRKQQQSSPKNPDPIMNQTSPFLRGNIAPGMNQRGSIL